MPPFSSEVQYEIEVFFDGACPLCRREISLLRSLDRRKRILFTDISLPTFDATQVGRTQTELMEQIYGRLADGTWATGVEVFRRLYAAVGLGWIVAATRLPSISHLFEIAYACFAKHRLRLTGRCDNGTCRITAVADSAKSHCPEVP